MKRFLLGNVALSAVLGATTAFAKGPGPKSAPSIDPSYNWSGFYMPLRPAATRSATTTTAATSATAAGSKAICAAR
jgi:hypothetical protein